MKTLLKEPLLHFLVIGAMLFIVFELFSSSEGDTEKTITITSGNIRMLQANFSRTWKRQPTPEELEGLIKNRVREEMAYLEAQAMGLDQEDPYIRNRLRMKMELFIEDLAASIPPSDEELAAYLDRHQEKYRVEEQIAFSHVYLNPDRRPDKLNEDVAELLFRLEQEKASINLEDYGDFTMLDRTYPLTSVRLIDRQFGRGFSDQIRGMKPGSWSGPVESSYGLHVILLEEFRPAYDPPLSDIRDAVERDFMAERKGNTLDNMYDGLREKYSVSIEYPTEQN